MATQSILVTGGSGLVGSALKNISTSRYEWHFLRSVDCDLRDYNQVIQIFNQIQPTYVIHLAANVGGLFKNQNQPCNMLEDNLRINTNVLKASYLVNVKKLIACLSTCIFPNKIEYPINESQLHLGPPHSSNYAYAYAKRILELQCRTYNEQYGTNFVCIIPTNIYGPGDNYSLVNGHVIPALIHKCYIAKQENKDFVICGTGTPLRQFIYSDDLAHLIMWTLETYPEKTPVILSVGEDEEISIGDVGKLIARYFDYEDHIVHDTSYSDGQFKKTASNEKLMSYIDYPFTPIEVGIEKSVSWFLENYEMARK